MLILYKYRQDSAIFEITSNKICVHMCKIPVKLTRILIVGFCKKWNEYPDLFVVSEAFIEGDKHSTVGHLEKVWVWTFEHHGIHGRMWLVLFGTLLSSCKCVSNVHWGRRTLMKLRYHCIVYNDQIWLNFPFVLTL